MFNYKFTDSNTLELIDEELAPLSCKEPRPVYAGELNLLGFDKLFNYPHDCKEPLMWGSLMTTITTGYVSPSCQAGT